MRRAPKSPSNRMHAHLTMGIRRSKCHRDHTVVGPNIPLTHACVNTSSNPHFALSNKPLRLELISPDISMELISLTLS